jgi:glycosyltransferase involved in cell wall biosynthesis
MIKEPIISIIVPVYKCERYLPKCLDSILSQSFTDFELILVNDGSPDGSGKICDFYSQKDKRIKVIHKSNGGASTARKLGVENANGKYIGWVDADDYIAPDMFSLLYNLSECHNADISECQYYMVSGEQMTRSGEEEPIVSGNGDTILRQFFTAGMKPAFWNKLYRRELFDRIEFPARQLHVDYYVNVLFALMTLKYVRTPKVKYYYMVRENSNMTTRTAREIREAVYLYEYTMDLTGKPVYSTTAKKYLKKDAINRLIGRYFEVAVTSEIRYQRAYTFYIKRKLGLSLVKYLISEKLPFKTRISYSLLLLNLKRLQIFLHTKLVIRNLQK